MKAIVLKNYGSPEDAFETIELPDPVPAPGELLIRVMATSVNPIDYKIRGGHLPHLVNSFPAVLHGDVAGVVEQVGPNVSDFKVGNRVYGYIGGVLAHAGALAELAVGKDFLFAKIPDDITFAQAAAIPLVGLTAYQTIFERVTIKAGDKVLVYGGSGGVGHIAVQFAKAACARVYATASGEKAGLVRSLGAEEVIDYTSETVPEAVARLTGGKGFDLVVDTVGNANLTNSFNAVKMNGNVVSILALTSMDISPLHEKALSLHVVYMITPFLYNDPEGRKNLGRILGCITKLVARGEMHPHIDRIFTFDQLPAAHRYAEQSKPRGKVVISREVTKTK